jgi:hypothetical protein
MNLFIDMAERKIYTLKILSYISLNLNINTHVHLCIQTQTMSKEINVLMDVICVSVS